MPTMDVHAERKQAIRTREMRSNELLSPVINASSGTVVYFPLSKHSSVERKKKKHIYNHVKNNYELMLLRLY